MDEMVVGDVDVLPQAAAMVTMKPRMRTNATEVTLFMTCSPL
jgi:hypothetical protein